MKANELRIGNWVEQPNDGVTRVTAILNDLQIKTETGYIDKYCRPIPLTEEWLVKFGFDQNNVDIEKYDCKWYKFSFTLDYWNAQKFFVYGYIGGNKTIKHVHQLQNLYFALTGEELEIKDK